MFGIGVFVFKLLVCVVVEVCFVCDLILIVFVCDLKVVDVCIDCGDVCILIGLRC